MPHRSSRLVGVVPAAGEGTRLFPYPHPKELLPVGSQQIEINRRIETRPKLVSQYLIENMIDAGVRRFFFVLGSGKGDIAEYYGSGMNHGVNIAYLYQEQSRGMPFAIDLIYPWIQGDETVLMGMPDTIIEPSTALARLLRVHETWNADLSLGLFPTDTPAKFGMIGIDDDFNVTEHTDKPAETDLRWLWGIACWEMSFMELLHKEIPDVREETKELVLGSLFDLALDRDLVVKGLPFENGRYIDVGTYDDLRRALELYA